MSAADRGTSARWSREHFGVRCAILTASVAGVSLPVLLLSYTLGGLPGLSAATASMVICYASALVALMVSAPFRGPNLALVGMLLGMFCRTGLPLGAALLMHWQAPGLMESGLLIYLLGYYLFCLALETWLSLPELSASTAANGTS